jgi:hypothetical protein
MSAVFKAIIIMTALVAIGAFILTRGCPGLWSSKDEVAKVLWPAPMVRSFDSTETSEGIRQQSKGPSRRGQADIRILEI